MSIKIAYADLEKFKYYCKNNNIVVINSNFSDYVECIIELNDEKRNALINDVNSENNYNIMQIDTIRQKNISVMSK